MRIHDHGVAGSKHAHVGRKGERVRTRKCQRQRIFEVKYLVAYGGLGREKFEDDLCIGGGGRQDAVTVVDQADLALLNQSCPKQNKN